MAKEHKELKQNQVIWWEKNLKLSLIWMYGNNGSVLHQNGESSGFLTKY